MNDTKTIQMFEMSVCRPSLDDLVRDSMAAIRSLFEQKRPVVIGYSSGKDSSTAADLVFRTAKESAKAGVQPLVIVMNGDTRIENPEIRELCDAEMIKMKNYGRKHGFKVIAKIAEPGLLSTFQVKILSGRGLPSYPGSNKDCSQDLKITGQRRARVEIIKSLTDKGYEEPVIVIGTRFDESEERKLSMLMRGERHDVPIRNKSNELVLSPIARYSTEDVFEYLGMASSGLFDSYSDMKEVLRIYAHAGGTSCAVVSHDILEGGNKRRSGGCGPRTGCHCCLRVRDASLKTMVEYDARYEYARPLIRFADLLRNTRYDWSKRNFVGRTIRNGWIAIEPDTFSASWVRDLTRMMLTIDHDERRRASIAGERPRFEMLPLDMKIAIDYLQNLNGLAPPFQLWADVRDIESGNKRYEVPEVPPFPPVAMPEPMFMYVGRDWETGPGWDRGGFRDAYFEALTEGSPCNPDLMQLSNGNVVWDMDTAKGFSIDPEVAFFIENEFQDDILKIHDNWRSHPQSFTAGWKWYSTLGTPTLDHSLNAKYDEVARRTEWKFSQGLLMQYDLDHLYSKSVRFSQMPEDARAAWSHKATNEGAQLDIEELFGVPAEVLSLMSD